MLFFYLFFYILLEKQQTICTDVINQVKIWQQSTREKRNSRLTELNLPFGAAGLKCNRQSVLKTSSPLIMLEAHLLTWQEKRYL